MVAWKRACYLAGSREASSGIMFCELKGLADLIYNDIRLLLRFDLGTIYTILVRSNFVRLAEAMYNSLLK